SFPVTCEFHRLVIHKKSRYPIHPITRTATLVSDRDDDQFIRVDKVNQVEWILGNGKGAQPTQNRFSDPGRIKESRYQLFNGVHKVTTQSGGRVVVEKSRRAQFFIGG